MAAHTNPKITAVSKPTELIISNWMVLLLPKLVKLAIIVTYMPANFDSVKSLHIMLLRKNWEFERRDRIIIAMYRTIAYWKSATKSMIIRTSRKNRIIRVLLWISYLFDQCRRKMLVKKNTGITRMFEIVVTISFEIMPFLMSSTVKLEEKYIIPWDWIRKVMHCRHSLYLGFTKYLYSFMTSQREYFTFYFYYSLNFSL